MNYRPVILILLMLLTQAAQGMLTARKTPTVCGSSKPGGHSCCAWLLEEQNSAGCGCMASREKSQEPAPASVPASSGRDLTASCLAIPQGATLFLAPPATGLPGISERLDQRRLLSPPHVRLPVLFCSFLI